jgi:hypothetical protein
MIIVHLIYNKRNLFSCSLTCRSWYAAAVPHLHHTVTTINSTMWVTKHSWPRPLLYMHRLGLLPLVKKLRIRDGPSPDSYGFSPRRLNICLLPRFFAFKNVRELEIEDLDIPRFMPWVRQYFRHLLPTVQSLTLRKPRGCHRQILYFTGLFQHLQDLGLLFIPNRGFQKEQAMLIPPFTPPLRGRLKMRFIKDVALSKEMIDLFGGIRFRHADLYLVDGMSLLLDACSETLETLRFDLTDPYGKQLCPKCVGVLANGFTARSSLQNIGLSRNKSLRALEVMARSIDIALKGGSLDSASSLLKHPLSTITSPAFLEIIVFYHDLDFHGAWGSTGASTYGPFYHMSETEREEEVSRHHRQFEVLHEVQKVRDFRLVLCADVWESVGEYSVRVLERAVAVEKAKGLFDNPPPEPTVVHRPRASIIDLGEEFNANRHIVF